MALLTMLLVAAGCGDGDEPEVTLRVTRDFGRELLAADQQPLEGRRTPVQLLRANHRAALDEYGYIVAIDGLRQDEQPEDDGHQLAWVVNVNGIETDLPPRELRLHDGDEVQFDLRDYEIRLDVRATVGAFAQTFRGGMLGVRFPVRVRCVDGYRRSCEQVRRALRAAGVDPSGREPTRSAVAAQARTAPHAPIRRGQVLVGPWRSWRDGSWQRRIDRGPGDSGVFARFQRDGAALMLLDHDENVVQTVGPGAGLVAAMRPTELDSMWLVTGVDREGVERAARALDDAALRDAFAVAVTDAGAQKLPLPAEPGFAAEPPLPAQGADYPGRVLVRGVRGALPAADGKLSLLPPGARAAPLGRIACSRVHASPRGPVLCLRVARNGFDREAVVLDRDGRPAARRRVAGYPSRVRVSPDGRYGAFTTFADPDTGYFASTDQFSTTTRIIDMRDASVLLELEDLEVRRDRRPVDLEGTELWGVTFGSDGRFLATLALPREAGHLLIEGQVGSEVAHVIARDVECPSLSPDGERIAYKRRIGGSNRWRLHVRDLASGEDVALAERRSIDDQPEWIGDRLVAYSDGRAVYVARADGSGAPELLAERATSPTWLPSGGRP